MLREVEETQSEQPLPASNQDGLATAMAGSQGVLQDLQGPFEKYESLGYQSKRAWDRLKWGSNDIAELRARLTSTTILLTAFLGSLFSTQTFTMELILAFSTSQVVVERKLNNRSPKCVRSQNFTLTHQITTKHQKIHFIQNFRTWNS